MGSNQNTRQQAIDGKVCYICETRPPELIDEVGGGLCKRCHARVEAMRLKYIIASGYKRRNLCTSLN